MNAAFDENNRAAEDPIVRSARALQTVQRNRITPQAHRAHVEMAQRNQALTVREAGKRAFGKSATAGSARLEVRARHCAGTRHKAPPATLGLRAFRSGKSSRGPDVVRR